MREITENLKAYFLAEHNLLRYWLLLDEEAFAEDLTYEDAQMELRHDAFKDMTPEEVEVRNVIWEKGQGFNDPEMLDYYNGLLQEAG